MREAAIELEAKKNAKNVQECVRVVSFFKCVHAAYMCSCTVAFCEHMIMRVCAHSISLRIVSFDRAFHP